MPVTPFHFGLGVVLKAVAPARTSLLGFIAAQLFIDVEPAVLMIAGDWPLHRAMHSLALATPSGIAAGLLVWLVGRLWLRLRSLSTTEFRIGPALASGTIGGMTHPLLDGIMHSDVQPFWPWRTENPFFALVGVASLHCLCVFAAVAGLALWEIRKRRAR